MDVQGDDIAIFQYTGGTTGIPKAAMSTHSALVANTVQCREWLARKGVQESFLAAIPLFHVFGMVAVMSFAVSVGAAMIMVPNARDITDVVQKIDRYRPTLFMGVPALYNAINHHPDHRWQVRPVVHLRLHQRIGPSASRDQAALRGTLRRRVA